MSNTSGKQLAVGVRRAVLYALDAAGLPLASGTQAYEGVEVVGPKAFTLTIPDARKISHIGNDRVLAIDYLPPTEGMSAELRVASNDMVAKALVSGVNTFNIGESTAMPWGTDEQGNEADVAMLLFQQSLDTNTKSRRWKYYILPKARTIPAPASMDENPAEDKYTVAPNSSQYHLWGTAMEGDTEGATEAGIIEGMSTYRPNIIAFKGDDTTDTFLFPADKPPRDLAKVAVWINGVEATVGDGLDEVTDEHIIFTVAPADVDGDLPAEIVVVFYEY